MTDTLPPDPPRDPETVAMYAGPLDEMARHAPPAPSPHDYAVVKQVRRTYREHCGYVPPATVYLESAMATILRDERERVLRALGPAGCSGCYAREPLRLARDGVETTTWGAGAWVHEAPDGTRMRCGLSEVRTALDRA